MSGVAGGREPTAWVDERDLGTFVGARYGPGAERLEIALVRFLAEEGIGELHRRERYRDGKRIGPDLKDPLYTAAIVMEVFEAARLASLRALARADLGLPLQHVELEGTLALLLEAGCDPPRSVGEHET